MFSKIKHILIDLLRGAATALIMGLLVSVAYGDSLWITLPVAAVFLFIAVLLLQCQRTGRRQLRSITAILLYLPAVSLYGRSGLFEFFFELMHPTDTEAAIGNAVQMVFIILPGAFILTLLAVLLACIVSQRQLAAPPKEVTQANGTDFPLSGS